MIIVKCPKCKKEVQIDLKNAVDEEGEVFRCPHCHYEFRYALK